MDGLARTIYLDHSATTGVDQRVLAEMIPFFSERYGNPSSVYALGRASRKAVDASRDKVAAVLGARASEVVFTGSGSESDNLAIKGVAFALRDKGRHIITSSVEHHAVLHTCQYLEKFGYTVTYLPVDKYGIVDPLAVAQAITPQTILVSIMYANNEVGTIEPISQIGAICRERKVAFHSDAVQAAGYLPLDVNSLNVDLLSISAHKFHGPKGVGALYVRQGVRIVPQVQGGSQERAKRAGTENVPGIVGLATALTLAQQGAREATSHASALRDRLVQGLAERVPRVTLTGHPNQRLPNHASFCFEFVEGESVLLNLDLTGIAASSGSACASGSLEASHVLLAMGVPPELAHASLRLSVGKDNTEEEIDYVLDVLPPIIEKLRALSSIQAH